MLEVEDILPSPLTPKPVCEMQTPALFTIGQSSPQPQSVDTAKYARVFRCLQPPPHPPLQVNSDVWNNHPHSNTRITTTTPAYKFFWADEVAIAEQLGRSTPETVFSNWAYSGMIRGSRPRSQPLVYPPPVVPTSSAEHPHAPSSRYGLTIPPLRPKPSHTTTPLRSTDVDG